MSATILQKLERIPPFVCRLIARENHGNRGLTHADLAQRSGLAVSTIKSFSFATTFRGRDIEKCQAFALACGVNHLAAERQIEFIKRRRWVHVERATGNQARMYQRLKRLLVSEAAKRKKQP